MSLLLDTSVALARAWSNAYTRGLPADERAARRNEIESDIWEQQQDGQVEGVARADVGFDILVRVVTGIPADIAWRRSVQLRGRATAPARRPAFGKGRKMAKKMFVTFSAALALVLGAVLLLNAAGMLLEGDYFVPYGVSQVISGIALIASVPLGARSSRKAVALVAAATIIYAVVHVWMAVLVVPFALILVGGAWLRARSTPPPLPQG